MSVLHMHRTRQVGCMDWVVTLPCIAIKKGFSMLTPVHHSIVVTGC